MSRMAVEENMAPVPTTDTSIMATAFSYRSCSSSASSTPPCVAKLDSRSTTLPKIVGVTYGGLDARGLGTGDG